MGFFDRFTGKELALSIETYTNQYGEILVGIHHAIQQHQQQLITLRRQIDVLVDGRGRHVQLLGMLAQNSETIERSMDLHVLNQTTARIYELAEQLDRLQLQLQDRSNLLQKLSQELAAYSASTDRKLQETHHHQSARLGHIESVQKHMAEQIKEMQTTSSVLSKQVELEIVQFRRELHAARSEQQQHIAGWKGQLDRFDQEISAMMLQFGMLQEQVEQDSKRWEQKLGNVLTDWQQTLQANLHAIREDYETKLSELQQEQDMKIKQLHRQLAVSRRSSTRRAWLFGGMLLLFAIWEVYQYVQQSWL